MRTRAGPHVRGAAPGLLLRRDAGSGLPAGLGRPLHVDLPSSTRDGAGLLLLTLTRRPAVI